jgi:hypothetical protein
MKTITMKLIVLLLFVFAGFNESNAQMYQIGTGITQTYYPYRTTWMDARTQMLYLQTELSAAGVTAGNIYQIGFEVATLGLPMNGFNVRIKGTSATALTAFETTGWTTVYSGSYTVPATGWQMLTLQTPYYWNGTDNLLIEVCFDNNTWSGANEVYSHSTAFNSVFSEVADLDPGSGCDLAAGAVYTDRPNLRLIALPTLSCGNTYAGELTLNSNWQSAPYTSGTIPIWSFSANAGEFVDFSMCTNTEDSYLRIFNSMGTLVYSADDNGPHCSGMAASMSFICPSTGLYYVVASHYSCSVLSNAASLDYRVTVRACADCTPVDQNLGNIGSTFYGYSTSGNMMAGGKWVGSFNGIPGMTYYFDLCPDLPGSGTSNFDIDIKIVDGSCNILNGVDGSCVAEAWRPNDFSWTCNTAGTYYVILAPYASYSSHSCTGVETNTFTMEYYSEYNLPEACPPGAYVENEPDCYDGYIDAFNGGCNSIPEVFSVLPNNCSQFICGKSGLYNSESSRDTDWYQFTTTDSTEVYLDFIAEFDTQLGIIDGTSGCPVSVFHTVITVPLGVRDTLSCVVGPGTWWIWVGSSSFSGCPCGSDYQMNFWTVNTPPAPIVIADSACYGISYLEMPVVPGVEYYWQGSSCGNDNTMPASAPYLVTTTGNYFVRAYNSGNDCWSDECSGVLVEVFDPLTVIATSNMNAVLDSICLGDSIILNADVTGATGSLEYRWREGATILRDWDPVSEFAILSPAETTYTVDVHHIGSNGILVLHADDSDPGDPADIVYNYLLADPRFDTVALFDARAASPTLAELHEYSAVITWTNYPFLSNIAIGDTLAQYVDEGGNVLVVALGLLAGGSGWGITGRFLNDGYSPIVQTDAFIDYTAVPIGTISNPSHPVLAGITDVTGGYMIVQTLMNTGASDIFWWTNGNLGLAEKSIAGGGTVMAFNAWPGNWGGAHADMLMANILAYMSPSINPCEYSDSVSILIFDAPNAAGTISGDAVVCNETTGNVYSVGVIANALDYDWSYSGTGATINGNTNSITVDFAQNATSGTLSVAGVNDCGPGAAATFDITVNDCTSIDENQPNSSLSVVPNPSNGQFYIEFSAVPGNKLSLVITNAVGQIVFEDKNITSAAFNQLHLNLTHLPAGTYSVRISGNEIFTAKHFVIQK